VIACTMPFDGEAAAFLSNKLVEIIIAPDFTEEALQRLEKKKNIMLLKLDVGQINKPQTPVLRQVLGGMLQQDPDNSLWEKWESVTSIPFPEKKRELAEFSMVCCKNTKSNAIVLCEEYAPGFYHVLGMGAGQPNRVDSLRKLAATKALENLNHTYEETNPGIDREEWIHTRLMIR
jgi:phosphoribosylaminoimidazolecarboxamide formyltransferase/IMP cyclohydrolase